MNRFVYRAGQIIFGAFFKLFFRMKVVGAENVPDAGPVVLCSNHRSYWDPALIGCAVKRPVHFMAKEGIFRVPVFGKICSLVGAFPVKRSTADLGSFRHALAMLKANEMVGLFPEGTRSRDGLPRSAHPGAMLLAISAGAPILPVAIAGSIRAFGSVQVRIGPPLDVKSYRQARRSGQDMTELANELIMGRIRALLASESAVARRT